MRYVLSADFGTTSLKTVLYDETLTAVRREKVDYPTEYPAPDRAEQNPDQWWDALKVTVGRILDGGDCRPHEIAVIAVDAMTPVVVPIGRDGKPLRKAMIWMDRRAENECRIIGDSLGDQLYRISGNKNDPSNFAPKLRWIRDNEPEVYGQTAVFLHASSYIVFRLTGVPAMDITQCGLSQLCDIGTGDWCDVLIDGSGLDREKLPCIVESTEIVGQVGNRAAEDLGLSTETRVIAGAMDNVAAGLGAGVMAHGDLYISAGTATNIVLCTDRPDFNPNAHLYRHIVNDRWIRSAGVDYGGAGYRWLANLIGENDWGALDRRAEMAVPGERPLVFLPYMVGQRAPLWNSRTRGVLFGMDPMTGDGELARAFMEGNALGAKKVLDLMTGRGTASVRGMLTGGCSGSRVYSRIFADVLGMELHRVGEMDTAALGMGMAGALAAGMYEDFQSMAGRVPVREIQIPDSGLKDYYGSVYRIFNELYSRIESLYDDLDALRSREVNE